MYRRVEDREETPWRLLCPRHGKVFLTREEYEAQTSSPDALWQCPALDMGDPSDLDDVGPGVCGAKSRWDDAWFDRYCEVVEGRHEKRFQDHLLLAFGERALSFSTELRDMLRLFWDLAQEGMVPENEKRQKDDAHERAEESIRALNLLVDAWNDNDTWRRSGS